MLKRIHLVLTHYINENTPSSYIIVSSSSARKFAVAMEIGA